MGIEPRVRLRRLRKPGFRRAELLAVDDPPATGAGLGWVPRVTHLVMHHPRDADPWDVGVVEGGVDGDPPLAMTVAPERDAFSLVSAEGAGLAPRDVRLDLPHKVGLVELAKERSEIVSHATLRSLPERRCVQGQEMALGGDEGVDDASRLHITLRQVAPHRRAHMFRCVQKELMDANLFLTASQRLREHNVPIVCEADFDVFTHRRPDRVLEQARPRPGRGGISGGKVPLVRGALHPERELELVTALRARPLGRWHADSKPRLEGPQA